MVDRLDDDDLVAWTARAAALLARLQELTGSADGTVLVHGDFWLGNLLVEGDRVTGLVDWGDARRGSPDVDRRFLVESLARRQRVEPALRARLEEARDAALPGPALAPPPPVGLVGTLDGATPRIAQAPEVVALGDATATEVEAWLADQPVPPVLLPVSAAGLALVSRHRDRWAARLPLPPTDVVDDLVGRGVPELLARHGLPAAEPGDELLLQAFVDDAGVARRRPPPRPRPETSDGSGSHSTPICSGWRAGSWARSVCGARWRWRSAGPPTAGGGSPAWRRG